MCHLRHLRSITPIAQALGLEGLEGFESLAPVLQRVSDNHIVFLQHRILFCAIWRLGALVA